MAAANARQHKMLQALPRKHTGMRARRRRGMVRFLAAAPGSLICE